MAIRFACEQCGHSFHVDEAHAGHLGRCSHCGHIMRIPHPQPEESPASPSGLKLRPIEGEAANHAAEPATAPGLQIRPVPAEDLAATRGHDPLGPQAEPEPERHRGPTRSPYVVLDPDHSEARQARSIHLNPHYETRLARFAARNLRWARDSLFVISVAFLAVGAIGLAFDLKSLRYVAVAGVVGANVGMLVVSLFYLITLPFKDSLAKGLGTLLLPPYAVYYWVTHWPRMRRPVINTAKSFAPIAMLGLAYVFYVEAPVIEQKGAQVEKVLEDAGKAIEQKGDEAVGQVAPSGEAKPADEPAPPVPKPRKRTRKARAVPY